MLYRTILTVVILALILSLNAQHHSSINQNKPEREEWFTNLGLGMFIHWSFDVQLGMVISHSVVGASPDYQDRYFNELPETFEPTNFQPEKWARMARMAGMKYVVFTAKHHSGFCMYDTKTTGFNIMNTAFNRDATREILDACRNEGLATGLYFSPDDFWYTYSHDLEIGRRKPGLMPSDLPELMEYLRKQMQELMTQYDPVDIVFIDGVDVAANVELAKICWELNPEVVVTRGAMETPEQQVPDQAIPSPWEACITMGQQWQYRPTNETYKNGGELIRTIIEIRSKGGNLLLNIGPDAEGEIPDIQKGLLNELGLWYFINKEAMEKVEPWPKIREGDVWFLKKQNENTLYVFITGEPLKYGGKKDILLKSVAATEDTRVSVIGHDNKTLEYNPDVNAATVFEQTDMGLKVSVFRGQRIYNDRQWPNPIVVKLENVIPSNEMNSP
ncbi:MAG: alpha-L-fucosidase [Bacteroidota bacterium]|nr:alpha-L-fucosidase [Bacteroidota bacterium]